MISLHEPYFDENDEALVLETLRSTWVSTGGPFVDQFEKETAAFVGSRFAISTSNGTTGIQLMVHTLKQQRKLGRFDRFEVLVPTLTFIATANAVVHAGGDPIFVDCAPGSLNVKPSDVEAFVRKHYRFDESDQTWRSSKSGFPLLAYMPVHVMGWASWQKELADLSKKLRLTVLEDAAEAMGTLTLEGLHAGRAGLASVLSFNGNKILTTGGGGMILTDDEAFATLAKHLGTTAKTDGLHYIHDQVGFNFRLVNVLAAFGCSQLKRIEQDLAKKKAIFEAYKECLNKLEDRVSVYRESGCRSNNWLVNIVFKDEVNKNSCLTQLMQAGIGARPLWTPLHMQPAYQEFEQAQDFFPNATFMWERTLSLPSSPKLSLETIASISSFIVKAIDSRR